jgi:uncharacterized protein DUF6011
VSSTTASPEQLDLIERLIAEKLEGDTLTAAQLRLSRGLDKSLASAWIEKLLKLPTPRVPGSDLDIALTYLEGRNPRTDFEQGLLDQYAERGSLSPRQIQVCVERVTKLAGQQGATQGNPSLHCPLLPPGRYAVQVDGQWQLVRVWRGTRNPNVQHVYEVRGTEKGVRMEDAELEAKVTTEIAKDPIGAAVAFGHRTGSCSKCGLTLDNNLTRFMGIGPVCIKHYTDDDTRLDMMHEARTTLRDAGIDPKGSNDDLSAVIA